MENINKLYKPTISIREIDGQYYIIISDSIRHYRGFDSLYELYESNDFLHYASKFNFLE